MLAMAVVAAMAPVIAAQAQDQSSGRGGREIIQSVPPGVPVEGTVPPLKLTDDQRQRIRQVLLTQHTDVDLALKENKPAESFEARVGDVIPKPLQPEAFPQPLISEIPATRAYAYLKFKGQVLIVNPMTNKIVDMFAETGG
jgi:hypothetical protein